MNIILYSTDCPKCKVIESKLKDKNIKFETCKDVDLMQEKGFTMAPMLEVDGEIMDFIKANKWVNAQ